MVEQASWLIKTEHLHKTVQSGSTPLTILHDINLSIDAGQSVAILGRSGSGKTTLLSLLAGLDLPSSGEVYFGDNVISTLNEDERAAIRNHNIGIIFQTFQLIPSLTAIENVLLPLEIAGEKNAKRAASEWLARVGLNNREHHYPAQLSGGEQQRVAIARAFAISPKVLFADEPTGNLDDETAEQVIELLFELNSKSETTLVIVTHDNNLANKCGQRFQLESGKLL